MKPKDGEKWTVKCEDHGTGLPVKSRAQRDTIARTPADWCAGCAKQLKAAAATA